MWPALARPCVQSVEQRSLLHALHAVSTWESNFPTPDTQITHSNDNRHAARHAYKARCSNTRRQRHTEARITKQAERTIHRHRRTADKTLLTNPHLLTRIFLLKACVRMRACANRMANRDQSRARRFPLMRFTAMLTISAVRAFASTTQPMTQSPTAHWDLACPPALARNLQQHDARTAEAGALA